MAGIIYNPILIIIAIDDLSSNGISLFVRILSFCLLSLRYLIRRLYNRSLAISVTSDLEVIQPFALVFALIYSLIIDLLLYSLNKSFISFHLTLIKISVAFRSWL